MTDRSAQSDISEAAGSAVQGSLQQDGERRDQRWAALRRLTKHRPAMVGLIILVIALFVSMTATVIAPHDPREISAQDALTGVSVSHPMGTDDLGRDVFSRVLYGVRMSMLVAVLSVGGATLVGVFLGLVSGYFGRWVDEIIMRLMDVLYAFPDLLLALALVATFGTGVDGLVVAIMIGRIPGFARVTRASVLSVRENDYVESARAIGLDDIRIVMRYILPNGMAPIIVMISVNIAIAILVEAGLSFLGLGIQPPMPSLGGLLRSAMGFMNDAPWMAIFPGLAIALIVFSLNILGDAIRDVLDPRLQ